MAKKAVLTEKNIFAILLLVAISLPSSLFGQNSVLASGSWFKLAIPENGVYKINTGLLKKMGFNTSTVDPRKIKIYGNSGGMLPQANSAARPNDLTELSIFVKGEEDGTMNSSDYILFYAEGPSRVDFIPEKSTFRYEHNLYDSYNYYFITVAADNGKRIQEEQNLSGNFPVVNEFDDYSIHELESYNELKSGREWYGERFDLTTSQNFTVNLSGVKPNSSIKVISSVMAESFMGSSFQLFFNNVMVGEQPVIPVPNAQYVQKGAVRQDTLTFSETSVQAEGKSKQELRYNYVKQGTGKSIGFLDYFIVQVVRELKLYGNQTRFRSKESTLQDFTTYQAAVTGTTNTIWDISDPQNPIEMQPVATEGKLTFSTASQNQKEFMLFNENIPAPGLAGVVANQNLHALPTPEMIIVAYSDFLAAANQLAEHRQSQNQWNVKVVTVDQVFNEFASGRKDVTAIRDFMRYLDAKSPNTLKALLLFGKCSYDYKAIRGVNTNFVPTYESRNSLHPLLSYSSDDYFGFLENDEGEWGEDPAQPHTMDIAVGRLPFKTNDEADHVVSKIIAHDIDVNRLDSWRNEFTFVADDGDASSHQYQSDQLAQYVEDNHPEINTHRVFLDAFPQPDSPAGQTSPKTSEAILNAFDRGSLIVNYTGHGSERLWAQERILDDAVIKKLHNNKFPLMVTATCEFGRYDDPLFPSNGEQLLMKENAGAVGLVSTARLVQSSTNFSLNKSFYQFLFEKEDGEYHTIGEVFRKTKNNSQSGVSNRNFSLLCDPGMLLGLPALRLDSVVISGTSEDTLKALSTVAITAKVTDKDGELVNSFNGDAIATVFGQKTILHTLGDENDPEDYSIWGNKIFSGRATVENGVANFNFIVPANIVETFGKGKVSFYAFDAEGHEATGALTDVTVGGIEDNTATDILPPQIELFIGDTTFVDGGLATPDTYLVARLSDESGISISGYGEGNGLIAVLDDTIEYDLSDYYEALLDDYRNGIAVFPVRNLLPGIHTIKVKAQDSFGNKAASAISFEVLGNQLVIDKFLNYPNPFRSSAMLFLTHNRSGDDLSGKIVIYNLGGEIVQTIAFEAPHAPYRIDLFEIYASYGPGRIMSPGVYMARVFLRSDSTGSSAEKVTKLIISN